MAPLGVPEGAGAERAALPLPPEMPPPIAGPPTFVAHCDVTPENIVFLDGEAIALIDFDLAGPATRVDEVCNVLLWWAPLVPPADREPVVADVDAVRRAALIVDEYGLGTAERERVVAQAVNKAERPYFSMRTRAEGVGTGSSGASGGSPSTPACCTRR